MFCTVVLRDGSEIRIGAVHLDPEDTATRIGSAKALLEHMNDASLPVVLAGDFNCEPGADAATALDLFSSTHRRHNRDPTVHEATYPSSDPNLALDWVIVSKDWVIAKNIKLPSTLSDHRPVIVQVGRESPWFE
ncbi:MAG: endonuclease/exonuclease/phosphatase family protein [Limisphaerales bacterium]